MNVNPWDGDLEGFMFRDMVIIQVGTDIENWKVWPNESIYEGLTLNVTNGLQLPISKSFKYCADKTWEFMSGGMKIFKIRFNILKFYRCKQICSLHFFSLILCVVEKFAVYILSKKPVCDFTN
jgi:hypothetical protein